VTGITIDTHPSAYFQSKRAGDSILIFRSVAGRGAAIFQDLEENFVQLRFVRRSNRRRARRRNPGTSPVKVKETTI